ncbi:MAG: protoglobin domain-containing protein [Bacillaceae bacterium]|nr:protoglobin domain-containing protein [Bacillaceae bacterium]
MKRIRTSDHSRLEQIKLTGITEDRLAFLSQYKTTLIPIIPSVVDELYDELLAIDELRHFIDNHSTLSRLKEAQKLYLEQCFSGIIDDAYIQGRFNIGRVHSHIGLELKWYLGTYTKYLELISNQVEQLLPEEHNQIITIVQALFSIDMQITLDSYNHFTIDKVTNPLRHKLNHMLSLYGFTEDDFNRLDDFAGLFSFQIDDIFYQFARVLDERLKDNKEVKLPVDQEPFYNYFKNFLNQFFQEKIYRQLDAYYRIIRDWSLMIIDNRSSSRLFDLIGDCLVDAIRSVFISKTYLYDVHILNSINTFERFVKFSNSLLAEMVRPYLSLKDFNFLDIGVYEISNTDFGRITWVDEKLVELVKTKQYISSDKLVGRRCYEALHGRVIPCPQCPVLKNTTEPILVSIEDKEEANYFKIRQLPVTEVFHLSRSILLMQDTTKEAKMMFDTLDKLLQLAEFRDDDTGNHINRIGILSGMLARLAGRDEAFVEQIAIAAKFHDIGKVGIPDPILNKEES